MKLAIAGVVGAFLVFYIMKSPDEAATIAKGTWHLVSHVAHSVGDFVNKLVD